MIKFFNFKKTNNFKVLEKFLEKRRSGKNVDTSIVKKILNDETITKIFHFGRADLAHIKYYLKVFFYYA